VHPGDLAGGFTELEMTWLLYCAGAATGPHPSPQHSATSPYCSHWSISPSSSPPIHRYN